MAEENAVIARAMPHVLEAEQSLIGAMLVDKEAIDSANSLINTDLHTCLDCRVPERFTVKSNSHHLLIALTELLFNALHFTRKGNVTMRVETGEDAVRFTVEDTGPGIPQRRQNLSLRSSQSSICSPRASDWDFSSANVWCSSWGEI